MHMRKMTRLCALLLALLLPWGALGETDISLSVGYDGLITYGKALPVTIRLENHGEDFSGVAAIDIAVSRTEYNRYEQEFFLAAGAVKEFCFPVRIDSRQTRFTAELLQAHGIPVLGESQLDQLPSLSSNAVQPSSRSSQVD